MRKRAKDKKIRPLKIKVVKFWIKVKKDVAKKTITPANIKISHSVHTISKRSALI